MTNREMGIDLSDLIELGEMLQFLSRWITGADHEAHAASLERFVGRPEYNLQELHNDLLRFAFLLGADDDEQFVNGD